MTSVAEAATEIAIAQRDRALGSVRKLVRQLERIGGYTTPEQQAELWEARALLAESER